MKLADQGLPGKNLPNGDPYAATAGSPGWTQADVRVQNKGFLFNFLPEDDTICKGDLPKKIIGSWPRGGDAVYAYQWFVSTNKLTWDTASIASFNVTLKDFQPPMVDTSLSVIYYKRVVLSGCTPPGTTTICTFIDESTPNAIHLYPPITNNSISSPDTTLCSGTIPNNMSGTSPGGGTGTYIFFWEMSSKLSDWSKADTLGKLQNFTPSQKLIAKTSDSLYFFRRSVTSGGCTDHQNSIIIKIIPRIKGNHIIPNQVLCQKIIPSVLHPDSVISGGNGTYRYKWQASYNNLNPSLWDSISNLTSFQPDTLNYTRFYRRIVFSGPGDVCRDSSNNLTLTVRPLITNNILISADTTICAGFAPNPFKGLKPAGGDTATHYYQYFWLVSTDSIKWNPTPVFISHGDTTGYISDTLEITRWFKRVVISGVEAACKDSNNLIKITVHPRIANNLIASGDTICKGQIPIKPFTVGSVLTGGNGIYKYKWESSYNINPSQWDSISNLVGFAPDTLTYNRYYRRIVFSGACADTMQNPLQNPLFIKVLQPIGNNYVLISDTIVCKGTSPKPINILGSPTGGNSVYNYSWQNGNDSTLLSLITGQIDSVYSPATIDTTTFIRRKVISGPCQSLTKALTIRTHQIPAGYLSGIDSSICDNGKFKNIRLRMSNGKAPWDIYLSNSFSVLNIASNDTTVEKTFSPVNSEKQIFTFTIDSLRDDNKCRAILKSGQIIDTVYSLPVSSSVPLRDTVCGNQSVLKGGKPAYAIGTWQFGTQNISISDLNNPNATITNNRLSATVLLDSIRVIWNVYNWDSACSVNDTSTMFFYNKPAARILVPSYKNWIGRKDTTIFNHDDGVLIADSIMYPNTGSWSYITTGTPVQFTSIERPTTQIQGLLNNNIPGAWTIFWTVQNLGCPAIVDTAYITSSRIHPYKGFSPGYGVKAPDGTPVDEVYWIEGIEYEPDFNLTILSSWNKVVYTYHGSGQQWTGWDGKGSQIDNNGNDMPVGTYYYILEVKDQKYSGSILLRRKD